MRGRRAARAGLFAAAVAVGLSPFPLGWLALARGRVAAGGPVDVVAVRPVDPPPKVGPGPHLPKGCRLLLARAKPERWSVLLRRWPDGSETLLKRVRRLHGGAAAWLLVGTAPPPDYWWPALAVARAPRTMLTTAYDPGPGDNGAAWADTTRTGVRARFGIAAVDPDVIALGTRLYVEGYGPALAADVGGRIKGAHVDLCFNSSAEARAWGRRRRRVWLVDPAPKALRPSLRALGAPGL